MSIFKGNFHQKKILFDCEKSSYEIAKEIWPHARVQLCRVHIIRAYKRNFIDIFGKIEFESNPNIKILYKILQGLFFIPVTCFPIIIQFFESEFRPLFSGQLKKFDKMLKYLTTNYLNPLSKFRPSMWSCYNEISDFQCVENSTNFVESINGALVKFCPRGTITFSKAVETIHAFKLDAMEKNIRR